MLYLFDYTSPQRSVLSTNTDATDISGRSFTVVCSFTNI